MVRNLRNLVVLAAASTVLEIDCTGNTSADCDWFADTCLLADTAWTQQYMGYVLDTSTGMRDRATCQELCSLHVSCTSMVFESQQPSVSYCYGLDDLEAETISQSPTVVTGRWSCRGKDNLVEETKPRVWFNAIMGTTFFFKQEGCVVTIENVNNASETIRAQAGLGELTTADGVVGKVMSRDKNLPKTIEWQPTNNINGPHGTEVADCPAAGWEFDVISPSEPREWWDAKDQIKTPTMTSTECVLDVDSHLLRFKAPKKVMAAARSPYFVQLQNLSDSNLTSALLYLPDLSVAYMYGMNTTGKWVEDDWMANKNGHDFVPLPMPLCDDLDDHQPDFPVCQIEEKLTEQQCQGCTFEGGDCICTDAISCSKVGGKWEEQHCKATAIKTQIWYDIDPRKAVERHYNDKDEEVSGINEWCKDPSMKGYMHEVAQGCCSSKVSICGTLDAGGSRRAGKCVTVPGETRMRLAARGYTLSPCTETDQNYTNSPTTRTTTRRMTTEPSTSESSTLPPR